jgi:hypothetical protein
MCVCVIVCACVRARARVQTGEVVYCVQLLMQICKCKTLYERERVCACKSINP